MFLAIKELIKEKSRFALIITVVVLVSYLAFFLTSLAYGLATSYTKGIDSWGANGIAVQEGSEKNIARSVLTEATYGDFFEPETMALLGVGGISIKMDGATEDVSFFGVAMDGKIAPQVIDGRLPVSDDEVVVAESLKRGGVALGDALSLKSTNKELKVVGFTTDLTFQTQPIVFASLTGWRDTLAETSGMLGMKDATTISAVVTFIDGADVGFDASAVSWLSIRDLSFNLPGYQAQVLTFSLMIGFLIMIAALVLAVFMYILTLQKRSIFGVLKAEGVSNSYISSSVVLQSIILVVLGLAIGLALALITGYFLAGTVPFMVNIVFFSGIVALFIAGAVIGSIASVASVSKIDPVEAIQ